MKNVLIFHLIYGKINPERMWLMFFDKFFRKKKKQDLSIAKYKKGDFVNFRHRGELSFGFIYDVFVDDEKKVTYTIQLGGQCPALLYGWKEEEILGIKER